MRIGFLLFFGLLFKASIFAQCPANETSLVIASQEELVVFIEAYKGCTDVNLDLVFATGPVSSVTTGTPINDISGLIFLERVVGNLEINIQTDDLNGFSNLREVTGDLRILNSKAIDFKGLSKLQKVSGDLVVVNAERITELNEFNNLESVRGSIEITQNSVLKTINGFDELVSAGGIEIANNDQLIDVDAFNKITEVEKTLEIGFESNIQTIEGFNELQTIGEDLLIRLNPNLQSVSSFNKLKTVGNTFRIETAKEISGFEELKSVGNHFELFGEGIETIPSFDNLETSGGRFSIANTSIVAFSGFNNLIDVGVASFEEDWFRVSNNKLLNNVQGFARFIKVEGFLEVKDNVSLSDCTWLCNILNNGEITGDLIIQNNLGECLTSIQVILICDPDFDDDGIPNVNDLDDDNDGIYDTQEGNGVLDTDKDGYPDSLDLDSDGDGCFDVLESGFNDSDNDGILGSAPNPVTINGTISDEITGYTIPADSNSNGLFDFQEDNVLDPGENSSVGVCLNEGKINLFGILKGEPDPGGKWFPALKGGSGIFDPSQDTEGIYIYTHTDAVCGDLSAEVKVEIVSDLTPGLDTEVVVCEGVFEINLFDAIDGNPSRGGTWLPKLESGTNMYNPQKDRNREYKYIILDRNCGTLQSTITFKNLDEPNSGKSTSLEICEFSESINLKDLLGETADDNGAWSPVLPNGIFDPKANSSGRYTYTVDNGICGLESSFVDVNVIQNSELDNVTININDFSSINNNIEIFVYSERDYEYSLDGVNYQIENVFNNVEGGLKTVYVRGLDGCEFYSKEVFVRTYPPFFTPNGDGNNDFWKLKDFPDIKYNIYIYSRFGRLIKEISSEKAFWDGTQNGKYLNSSNYWFKVVTESGEILHGNFSLLRK